MSACTEVRVRERKKARKGKTEVEKTLTVDSILLHRLLKRTALSVPFEEDEANSLFLVSSERVRIEEGPGSLRRLKKKEDEVSFCSFSFSFLLPSSSVRPIQGSTPPDSAQRNETVKSMHSRS